MIHRVSHGHAAHKSHVKFEGSKHTNTSLNSVTGQVKRYGASSTVANDLKAATTDNWVLYGSTFKLDKQQLATALADPKKLNALGYSLIFRADGSSPGGKTGNGWGGSGDAGPDMKMTPVSKGSELFKNVLDTVNGQFTPDSPKGSTGPGQLTPDQQAQKKKVDAGARAALDSMLAEPHTKLYWAQWDNQDDTTINGAISVNEKTGDVRVIGLWAPA